MSNYRKYWLFTCLGTLAATAYPLYMGFSVVFQMITRGAILAERYPKYIIPYTPIALAVLVGVAGIPFFLKYCKKCPILASSAVSLGVFALTEWLFESQVIVTKTVTTTLESWQMFMCAVQPELFETRPYVLGNILQGEYSPAFKLHFYMISVVLIIAILNCLYGYGQMLRTGSRTRLKALNVQSVCTALFLGMCILACFTAFFRDGELTVSALSAVLMGLFFLLLGTTAGTYAGSFLLGRKKGISVGIPLAVALLVTLLMYVGEMILLRGSLYRFGTGFLFDGLPFLVLAPVDILIVALSGGISAGLCAFLNKSV